MDKQTESNVYARISLHLNEMLYESGDITPHEYERAYMALSLRLTEHDGCDIINVRYSPSSDCKANPIPKRA